MKYDLVEATLNFLNGTRLFEMAQDLKDSRRTVGALSHHISEHLVKILYFGKSHRDYNHWCGEVNGALKSYHFKTFNNKYPSVEQFSNWFFDGNYNVDVDYMEAIKDIIKSDYNKTAAYDSAKMFELVRDVMLKCFVELSKGRHPNINKYLDSVGTR